MRTRILALLLVTLGSYASATPYWHQSSGNNNVGIYQWPYDGTLGGYPGTSQEHILNYIVDPDYTFLEGPLYNGYLTFALGRSVTNLEITLNSSTILNHFANGIIMTTATGLALSGYDLVSDSHFILDPFDEGVNYTILNQMESANEISLHVTFDSPIDFFAANMVGYDPAAFAFFMGGIEYHNATIIGDGVQFEIGSFIPEPATLLLLTVGGIFLRRRKIPRQ